MDVVVVGAGVFGTWSAHHLHEAGVNVALIDAYGPGNSRSSSGDETRILRFGYGPDAVYSELARRSLPQWKELEARVRLLDEPIWYPCGVLWLARADDAYTIATKDTLMRGGYPAELLDSANLRRRFPDINAEGVGEALLETEGGVLTARRGVAALASDLERRGVRIIRARVDPVRHVERPRSGVLDAIATADGSHIRADAFVFACGAWLPRVMPDLLTGLVRPTRQVVVYFGSPAGDQRFGPATWPAWIDFPAGIYGTPDIAGRGVKVGVDEHGPPIDPDTEDRLADAPSVERARAWLARRVPRLADAPVVETRVCQYENTATGDFLIDRHPGHRNVWIVGGGSGHGFKHGPAVGEMVARMVITGEAAHPRFALESKTTDVRRAVY